MLQFSEKRRLLKECFGRWLRLRAEGEEGGGFTHELQARARISDLIFVHRCASAGFAAGHIPKF